MKPIIVTSDCHHSDFDPSPCRPRCWQAQLRRRGSHEASHANISPDRQQDGEEVPVSQTKAKHRAQEGISYMHVCRRVRLSIPNEGEMAGSPTRYRAGHGHTKMQGLETPHRLFENSTGCTASHETSAISRHESRNTISSFKLRRLGR
jgi:hypothetical protein